MIKNIPASVMGKLKNASRKSNKPLNLIMQLYIQERLLYRLSLSKYNDNFLLKGGLLLYSMTEFKGRPTKDIDFLAKNIPNDPENIEKVFKDICNMEASDGVNFDLGSIKAISIKEGADYEGVRVKVPAFIGQAKIILQVDIGFGDIVIPKPVSVKYPALLDFENPEINAYSFDSVIAEKFEAIVSLSLLNSRMKDFYDIYELLNKRNFDGRVLQEAIFQTFQRRGTRIEKDLMIFSDDFANDSSRNKQWKLFLKKIGKEEKEFVEVIKEIFRFIKPIYNAMLEEEEFFYQWNCVTKQWLP
ncbi:MAG: nucleotidyl transferase AbiEii/AbiGii toxin family protein [Bacillota bacterium]